MSNETCTVTIADIYGAEWWERNKAELDRDWEWEFGVTKNKDVYAIRLSYGITEGCSYDEVIPRIILHRRKPKPPTLREVYGVDEVTSPTGARSSTSRATRTTPTTTAIITLRRFRSRPASSLSESDSSAPPRGIAGGSNRITSNLNQPPPGA